MFRKVGQVLCSAAIFAAFARCGSGAGGAGAGQAGSTSRFAVIGERLYTLSAKQSENGPIQHLIRIFDLSTPQTPRQTRDVEAVLPETLFTDGRRLYVGSAIGMAAYEVEDPDHPSLVASVEHARASDPVVVDGDTAYVTLRGSIFCRGNVNVLHVIDLSNLVDARIVSTFSDERAFLLLRGHPPW